MVGLEEDIEYRPGERNAPNQGVEDDVAHHARHYPFRGADLNCAGNDVSRGHGSHQVACHRNEAQSSIEAKGDMGAWDAPAGVKKARKLIEVAKDGA